MKKFPTHILLIVTLLLMAVNVFGKSRKKPAAGKIGSSLYIKAMSHLKNADYSKAEQSLSQLLKKHPRSSYSEEAYIMLTDIYLRLKEFDQAQTRISDFNRRFPQSMHNSRMTFYQGLVYLHQEKNYYAARLFVSAINRSQSPSLFANAKKHLLMLVNKSGLGEKELQNIIDKLKYDKELVSKLLIYLGDLQTRNENFKAAKKTLEKWLSLFPEDKQKKTIRNKLNIARKQKLKHRTLLLMVPLTGINMEIGKSLVKGIVLNLDKALPALGSNIRYKIIDTEGDPIIAISRLRNAIEEEEVIGIIGPAMSDISTAVAIELSSRKSGIPMITPTATTHGISALGTGIFQLNVTTAALGRAISDYAVGCMHLKEFAILAPNTEYGLDLAQAFESNITSRGGSIIAKEFYNPDAKDYAGHFKVIRHLKAKAYLEKKWVTRGKDPATIPKKKLQSWAADSVLRMEALFIAAGSGDEAHKLASQARYHKLKTKILGSSGWHDKSLILKGTRNLRGTIFSINFLLDEKDEKWKSFQKNYQERWKSSPDRVSALGYDAARFVIKGLRKGNTKELKQSLGSIKSFTGIKGKIVLDPKTGYNQSASLAQIGKRGFKKVEFCKDPSF